MSVVHELFGATFDVPILNLRLLLYVLSNVQFCVDDDYSSGLIVCLVSAGRRFCAGAATYMFTNFKETYVANLITCMLHESDENSFINQPFRARLSFAISQIFHIDEDA